ncbi:DUF6338 family protein [Histidinibacterium aquaticum]|uniref:Uncharacterized protein n=1 Tax=Histidinibacterium aquaticum TaxID=2613962 RepID=A0A5J5GND4_9RHOB|nr:DUF6338 family protein [Histidinibacterium aquaticum]KAA9009896.1 hypothetical protein F3S47_01105 [Histidinibacterium aquaticum]
MNHALAQLALIFLPGIIWANLDAIYGSGPRVDKPTLALNSFLFGITTYTLVYAIGSACGYEFTYPTSIISEEGALVDFADEILISVPASIILATIWLYMVRFRVIMKFFNCIGATRRFGLEDVWSFTFNSNQSHVEYVDVRDPERGFIYSGYVNAYSETEEFRELLLFDARIYTSEGDEVTEAPHLYLSMSKDRMWVEFPYRGNKE